MIGWNLCPFAAGPFKNGRVRIARAEGFAGVAHELSRLATEPGIATTLVIVDVSDWGEFRDLVGSIEQLLEDGGLEELFQVVGFHPDAVYEGADPDDPANAAARAPVPVVHLLRADDLEKAVAGHPDPEGISERNARFLRERE